MRVPAPALRRTLPLFALLAAVLGGSPGFPPAARADSVNSPNITLNVDTNRAAGPGAGNESVVVNTITIAEISLNEYSAGNGQAITLQARPGFQFDPASAVIAQSATIGFNGAAANVPAALTPAGTAAEALTFTLTSGTGPTQDIIRITGVRVRILSAAGAAGPAQTTLALSTASAGGAFSNQGLVAANITRGRPDRLVFSTQPGSTQSNTDLLPAVSIVDFGGNLVGNDDRAITLTLASNPGGTVLAGITQQDTQAGTATWTAQDSLRIATAAGGYTLRATHGGAAFLSNDAVESTSFDITAGPADHLVFTQQPLDTPAGAALLLAVTIRDQAENTVTAVPAEITLDSAVNPGGWPLLVDTSLTKTTVNGVAEWTAADNLRINAAVAQYRLRASGVGAPLESSTFTIGPAAPASLRFVQQPSDALAGAAIAPPVTVAINDAFGNRVSASDSVTLSLDSPCGGTLSGGAAAAAAGLATFAAVRIDTPCSSAVLEAAAAGLPGTASTPFAVAPLPPVALRFVQQPTAVTAGAAFNPPVSVEIVDAAGQRTTSTAEVELALLSACGGTLSSERIAAVGGLATFAVLSIDVPCAAVSLQATAAGLTGTTSDAFEVSAAAEDEVPACGACGQGSALVLAPLLLTLAGMKTAVRRQQRRRRSGV